MARALAIDTNVFLLADEDANCQMVAQQACYSCDYRLVFDRIDEKIRAEYEEYADLYPESWLRSAVKELIERTPAQTTLSAQQKWLPSSILTLPCRLTPEEYGLLACGDKAERHFFGVVRGNSNTYLIIPGDSLREREHNLIQRCYREDDELNKLRRKFPDIKIKSTDDLSWLYEPGDPAPEDLEQLEDYLTQNRLDATCAEREFIELKCPKSFDTGITFKNRKKNGKKIVEGLVVDIMEAICAMTNSNTGYIFVGVKDDGEIIGVPLKFNGEAMPDRDALWRKTSEELQNFWPRRPLFRQWWIQVSTGLMVLALRVERQLGEPLSYRGEVYVRSGTASVKRDGVQGRIQTP